MSKTLLFSQSNGEVAAPKALASSSKRGSLTSRTSYDVERCTCEHISAFLHGLLNLVTTLTHLFYIYMFVRFKIQNEEQIFYAIRLYSIPCYSL